MTSKPIEWKEKAEAEWTRKLVVDERICMMCPADYRDATPDDLRRACEAVGMVAMCAAQHATWGRDLDAATALYAEWKARAEKAEARSQKYCLDLGAMQTERDDLRTKLAAAEAAHQGAEEHIRKLSEDCADLLARVQAAESRLSALTAPVEGEPSDEELETSWWDTCNAEHAEGKDSVASVAAARRVLFRLGFGLASARHQRTEPTEEELVRVYDAAHNGAFIVEGLGKIESRHRAGVRAVAAHVRKEQCLVERAVAGGYDIEVTHQSGGIDVAISRPKEEGRDEGHWHEGDLVFRGKKRLPADKAATALAEMLGEVGA